jgi:hypothetical protein
MRPQPRCVPDGALCGDVAKHSPVLEARDRVLDPGSATAMSTPALVSADPVADEDRSNELGHSPITAVGEDASMMLCER